MLVQSATKLLNHISLAVAAAGLSKFWSGIGLELASAGLEVLALVSKLVLAAVGAHPPQ